MWKNRNFAAKFYVDYIFFYVCFAAIALLFQQDNKEIENNIVWKEISNGLFFAECQGNYVSKLADSKVSILKIDTEQYDFELTLCSETDSVKHTIPEWSAAKGYIAAINAGMYSLIDHLAGRGYTRNYNHINNSIYEDNFNALAAFNPLSDTLPEFAILDRQNQDWNSIVNQYNSVFQSIRMIDNYGKPVYWKNKTTLYCSMVILAIDQQGNVMFLFTRSPYSVNEMIDFMQKPELKIKTAMYLEGGPEACLYIKTDTVEIIKVGSYVSGSCPNDNNTAVRKIPNVLGVKRKGK